MIHLQTALLTLVLACNQPCGDWLETDWRVPPREERLDECIGIMAGPGGAITSDTLDECPSSQSCSLVEPDSDGQTLHYVRLSDGPAEPIILHGVDCAANTCEEIERSVIDDGTGGDDDR